MRRKLKSDGGETLVELLASILIASLSVTLVFGAIMASNTMDRQAQELDAEYYKEILSKAERQGSSDELLPSAGAGTVEVNQNGSIETAKPEVTFYGGKGAVSYVLKDGGGI